MEGYGFLNQESYEDAIHEFTQAIIINPTEYDAFLLRGLAYLDSENYSLAIADFTLAIKTETLGIDLSVAINNRGMAYAKSGKYNLAIDDFRDAILLNKELGFEFKQRINYLNLAESQYGLEQYDKAITNYTIAIGFKLDYKWESPKTIENLYWKRGRCYFVFGDAKKALDDLNIAFVFSDNH